MCPVGPVEGRIVAESAGGAGIVGRLTALNHGTGSHEALDDDIVPEGGAGGLLEDAADLRFASVKRVSDGLDGNVFEKVLIYVSHQLALDSLLRQMELAFAVEAVQCCEQQKETGRQVDPHVGHMVEAEPGKGTTQQTVRIALEAVPVLLAQRPVVEWPQQTVIRIEVVQNLRRKVDHHPLVRNRWVDN